MGTVYRGRDRRLGRPVTINFSAERFQGRFEREVRAVASLNHPNICTVYDVGANYLVMEPSMSAATSSPSEPSCTRCRCATLKLTAHDFRCGRPAGVRVGGTLRRRLDDGMKEPVVEFA